MKIAINDANILIDCCDIGLIPALIQLDFELHTTDFVMNEIQNQEQLEILIEIISIKKLIVNDFDTSALLKIIERSQKFPKLSIEDCSVLHLAEAKGAILLTGDGALRRTASKSDIEVHGILWILDMMVSQNILTKTVAFQKLQILMEMNPRLPQKACEDRLKDWKI